MKRHHKVLIVDDQTDFLSSMRRALRKEPYQVLTAEGGKAALRIMKAQVVDLVVSDYMMPEMSGLTLIKQIQSDYPHILPIMLTALAELDIAMQAINEAGVYKFILKPVEINSFRITLRRALESLDLMAENVALQQKIKTRDAILQELERKHPGITKWRDDDGCVLSVD